MPHKHSLINTPKRKLKKVKEAEKLEKEYQKEREDEYRIEQQQDDAAWQNRIDQEPREQ